MTFAGLPVTIVRACLRESLRDGLPGERGGSPTAVLDESGMSDAERRRVPEAMGTSHAVFLAGHARGPGGRTTASLRFFTREGELPACGHGTVAALAVLAARNAPAHPVGSGSPGGHPHFRAELRTRGRTFTGWCARKDGGLFDAAFDPGPVDLREPTREERESVPAALGLDADAPEPGLRVATVGRPRLLVPVVSRSALAALTPDLDRLRAACDRFGLLGAYAHSVPEADGRCAARMFAPSIGVPEDIANANSTACLAAHLAERGLSRIAVDMGDSLGSPATITATLASGAGAAASTTLARPVVHVGGTAEITGSVSPVVSRPP
ncbi:PhzF family phenazine biosynthesis protein [Actinacidiphila acidipaludis]|uniref:PhzF family phenazine biosynthesis protein n=1 Tax=Actinacidiphila acidipaludis TaxID=2873382 RepID=A0ABS7PZ91_9ACTN|nr:PhzF family phenazine biosynthesis protein [Streptomyces acidipaludis]MBY8876207.1 PhzF family phenazine biosynthesis protein [Streptomyces acidipaludis]